MRSQQPSLQQRCHAMHLGQETDADSGSSWSLVRAWVNLNFSIPRYVRYLSVCTTASGAIAFSGKSNRRWRVAAGIQASRILPMGLPPSSAAMTTRYFWRVWRLSTPDDNGASGMPAYPDLRVGAFAGYNQTTKNPVKPLSASESASLWNM